MDRRTLIKGLAMGIGSFSLPALIPSSTATTGNDKPALIQRLSWAGVRIVGSSAELLIDPVITDIWDGRRDFPLIVPDDTTRRRYALITHLHGDHFDAPGLRSLLGDRGRVICHRAVAADVASHGLKVVTAAPYQPIQRGGFSLIALPAGDGIGDDQVSWVVLTAGEQRLIHCGDSLWHGAWRLWGDVYGPFDAAFLPVNGAIQAGTPASEVPISMTPPQAVDAALLLRAGTLVPIHYGWQQPQAYEEFPDALESLRSHAGRRGLALRILPPGGWLNSSSDRPQ